MSNRTLLVIAVALIGTWLLLRASGKSPLPWNVGQAGSIFGGTQGGGGQ